MVCPASLGVLSRVFDTLHRTVKGSLKTPMACGIAVGAVFIACTVHGCAAKAPVIAKIAPHDRTRIISFPPR